MIDSDTLLTSAKLRNVGPATLADFKVLGITTIGELAQQDADKLYIRICEETARRHDPCVHDVFAAAIHQARTGEAVNWWDYSAPRKLRQAAGDFPQPRAPGRCTEVLEMLCHGNGFAGLTENLFASAHNVAVRRGAATKP